MNGRAVFMSQGRDTQFDISAVPGYTRFSLELRHLRFE